MTHPTNPLNRQANSKPTQDTTAAAHHCMCRASQLHANSGACPLDYKHERKRGSRYAASLPTGVSAAAWSIKTLRMTVLALLAWGMGAQAAATESTTPITPAAAPASAAHVAAVPGFRYRAAVVPASDEPLVRLRLPAWALAAAQTADGRDIQVFNAAGEALPVHVFDAPEQASAPQARTSAWLEPLQSDVEASAANVVKDARSHALSGQASTADAGISLHIAPGAAADVRIHTQPGAAAAGRAQQNGWGGQPLKNTVLFDARHVSGQWNALHIKARLPANQAIDVRLESSTNLRDWQTVVAGATIYQLQHHQQAKGEQLRISWPQPFASRGQFLRLRWQPISGEGVDAAQAPHILAVQLEHASSPAPSPALAWPLPAPVLNKDGSLQWGSDAAGVAGAWPAQALRLRITAPGNHYVPVVVEARHAKQPAWHTVQYATLWCTQGRGSADAVDLPLSAIWPQWRLQARSQQSLQALGLQASLIYSPQEIVFLRSGAGPYTLVSGSLDPHHSKALRLQPAELTQMHARWRQLPLAAVGEVVDEGLPQLSTWQQMRPRNAHEKRQMLLWAVLAVGLGVLAGVAWLLHRQIKPR